MAFSAHGALAGLAAFLMAGTALAQSLESELDDLVVSHPQIKAAVNTVSSATEGVGAARAGWWPTVALTGNVGNDYVDSPSRRSAGQQPYNHGRNQTTLTVTQKLFDGFLTEAAIDAAQVTRRAGEDNLEATRQTVLLEGLAAYLDVLRQTRLLALGRDNERNIRTQLQLEDERVKRGSGMAVDVLQAKHRLQVAKEQRIAIEGALQNALSRYIQVFGHAPRPDKMEEPQPAVDVIPTSLDQAIQIAEGENPSLAVAARAVDLAGETRRTAQAGYWPMLDAQARGNWEKDRDATLGIRRDWSALLQMNWELFAGFRTTHEVARAGFDQAASRDAHLHAGRKIAEQTRIAWSALETARERLAVLEQAVNLADEVWEMRKRLREAGKATVMDVLDAESDTYTARITYVNASTDMRLAVYQLLQAMGRLTLETTSRHHRKTAPGEPAPGPKPMPNGAG